MLSNGFSLVPVCLLTDQSIIVLYIFVCAYFSNKHFFTKVILINFIISQQQNNKKNIKNELLRNNIYCWLFLELSWVISHRRMLDYICIINI